MISWNRLETVYSRAAGIVLIVAAVACGWYYSTFDERNLQAVAKAQKNFYEKLQVDWLTPKSESMIGQTLATDADQFELMVLRTAMGRWRIRKLAPSAYERLEEQYADGLWNSAFLKTLPEALANIDVRWRSARAKAIARGGRVHMDVVPIENLGFKLTLPPGVTTPEIGSLLEVAFTVDNNATPPHEMLAVWTTVLDSVPRPYRERHCVVEDAGRRHNGKRVYRVTMDMSDSPEWLNPVVQVTSIHFNPQADLGLTALDYQIGDSKLLPVQ